MPSTQHRIRGLPEIKSKEECCKKIAVGREGEGNVHIQYVVGRNDLHS
jgi:hypothetical protein